MAARKNLEDVFGKVEKSEWIEDANAWKANLPWLKYAQEIALEVLDHLSENGISQKGLAEKMNVSPQALSKWLKGNENFTLETISKIESALGVSLINVGAESKSKEMVTANHHKGAHQYERPERKSGDPARFQTATVIAFKPENYPLAV